jgi:chemotaxis protein MotB
MMRINALLIACLIGLVGGAFAGCTSSEGPVQPRSSLHSVDSLRAANERLASRARQLADSLQFYDDMQSGQYQREQRALQDRIARLAYEVRLFRDGGRTVDILQADLLFAPGTARLTDGARSRLQAVSAVLRTTYRDRSIRVEAHTDSASPADSAYASHWALSAAQAAAVVKVLAVQSGRDPALFRAVACGAAQPIASNETRAGQARNRRVRIAVLPVPGRAESPYEIMW